MADVIVSVTNDDIAKGRRYVATSCPVARATKRRLRIARGLMVNKFSIWLNHRRIDAPPEVYDFVENFDSRRPVKPFRFKLPAELLLESKP